MNVAQLIGQLYDPRCEMQLYYDGWQAKTPRLNFTLAVDRPKSKNGSSVLAYVGCCIGGESARWFVNHVTHGDIVALDGFLDSRIVVLGQKKSKVETRLVVTHLNWVGIRKTHEIVAGSEKLNLGDVGLEKLPPDPTKTMTVVNVPEDDDNGQYDELPDWGGKL